MAERTGYCSSEPQDDSRDHSGHNCYSYYVLLLPDPLQSQVRNAFLPLSPGTSPSLGLHSAEHLEILLDIWHILVFIAVFVFSITYLYI